MPAHTLLFMTLILASQLLQAQKPGKDLKWPDRKKAAVCLTFDDALDQHLDEALPLLDSFDMKATFYCTGASKSLQNRTAEWQKVAKAGHELGNHTMHHPCDGNQFTWVKPEYDLRRYSLEQFETELKTTDSLLNAMDDRAERTFAYPCSNFRVRGDTSVTGVVASLFPAARSQGPIPKTMDYIDMHFMPSLIVDGHTGAEMIAYVEDARANGVIATFMFHGVGGGHFLDVDPDELRILLQYLEVNEQDYWVDTFYNVTRYIAEKKNLSR